MKCGGKTKQGRGTGGGELLLNCGVGDVSESLGLQGDQTSQS